MHIIRILYTYTLQLPILRILFTIIFLIFDRHMSFLTSFAKLVAQIFCIPVDNKVALHNSRNNINLLILRTLLCIIYTVLLVLYTEKFI